MISHHRWSLSRPSSTKCENNSSRGCDKVIFSMKKVFILTFTVLAALGLAYGEEKDKGSGNRVKFIGDMVVAVDEVVDGDVVVMQGNLRVKGVINGDAVVFWGDAFVDSAGIINGNLVTSRGKVFIDEFGKVTGDVTESRIMDLSFGEPMSEDFEGFEDDMEEGWREFEDKEADIDGHFSYNKVDGVVIGLKFPKNRRRDLVPNLILHGYGGYGFANDRWQFYAELDRWFFERNTLEFGVEGHKLTDTEDEWIIGNLENSLAAVLIHEDFRDYYYRTGFGAHVSQTLGSKLRLKVKYLVDEYDKAENTARWALFGGDKVFRDNYWFLEKAGYPAGSNIFEGEMRSVIASGELKMFGGDLRLTGSMESAGGELSGDFEFKRYIFEARANIDFGRYEGLDIRMKLGSSEDKLPPQKLFTLGGISTLRGFKHKEFTGSQMALLNLEYRMFERGGSSYLWFLDFMKPVLFADIGSTHPDIFDEFKSEHYKSDVGFGLILWEDARFDVARRTDSGDKPWVATFRLSQPF